MLFSVITKNSNWEVLTKNSNWEVLTKNSGFYPSTFLQLVNGSKNSILNWVLKLNLFKSLHFFLVCLPRKILDRFFLLFYTVVSTPINPKYILNYLICNSTKKYLQLYSKDKKQTWRWFRCRFFFCFWVLLIP